MKAAVVRAHGGPERLAFETGFPDPEPGEGDVVLAVKACSLNYHDVFTRRGTARLVRHAPSRPSGHLRPD